MFEHRIDAYNRTIEEAFKALNEVLKEMVQLNGDIDVDFLSLENKKLPPSSGHYHHYKSIRLSKK